MSRYVPAAPQSSGGNSTGQKCGDGSLNSNATAVNPPGGFSTRTTRAAVFAPDLGCINSIGCPGFTSICNFTRPPCAFTTIVCVSSRIRSCSSVSANTTIGICSITRSLRLRFAPVEGDMVSLVSCRNPEPGRRFLAGPTRFRSLCTDFRGTATLGCAPVSRAPPSCLRLNATPFPLQQLPLLRYHRILINH